MTSRFNSHQPIKKAAVLGAGVMGSQIAAHLANAGVQVLLLDMPAKEGDRNSIVNGALKKITKMKPNPFMGSDVLSRIKTGNFEDDLSNISDAEWVIEVIVENMDIKRSLMAKVEKAASDSAIISTNTSGLPIHQIMEGRSAGFKKRFLGTHFFNPPRYMKLLEIIPTPETDQSVIDRISDFCYRHLGKGVVVCKDTPNFIANRIGVFSMQHILHSFENGEYTIEEIDALTGPLTGRPKSATFRTADVVGLDTLMYVAQNLYDAVEGDESRELFNTPKTLKSLVENKALGAKSGAGFYKKEGKEIKSLNPETGQYESAKEMNLGDLSNIKKAGSLAARWKAAYNDDGRAGAFLRNHTLDVISYSINRTPEISDSPADIDKAIRWGFGWEMGPYEIVDAIGLDRIYADLESNGKNVPDWLKEMKSSGASTFYTLKDGVRHVWMPGKGYEADPVPADQIPLFYIKKDSSKELWKNKEAALLDIGDGVALYEFRSKANTLGVNVMKGLNEALSFVENNDFRGMVIGNEGTNFTVGANLGELAEFVFKGEMKPVIAAVENFQKTVQRIHYASKPVVVATHQKTLGGGCEIAMGASQIVAASETYIGLVELGVGLIPAGAGTMRMAARAAKKAVNQRPSEVQPFVQQAFETIAMAKVATSAYEAKELGYFLPEHKIVMHEDRRLHAAKHEVISLYEQGYRPPAVENAIYVVGKPGKAALVTGVYQMLEGGFISEYDMYLAERLAHILTGGELSGPQTVHEDYLLELEREVFLSLLTEKKTQARVESILKTNKPLRN